MKHILYLLGAAAVVLLAYRTARRLRRPVNPVAGTVTSPFGSRPAPAAGASTWHNGVDISVPAGTPVRSPWSGTVRSVYTNASGGRQMIVAHPNGYLTGYAHLNSWTAAKGSAVRAGQELCRTGSTGISTGPHLHFTLTDPQGRKVDPQTLFDFKA